MKIFVQNTTEAIKARARKLKKHSFKYEYFPNEPNPNYSEYCVDVFTKYLGTSLYNIEFTMYLEKNRNQIEFQVVECSCPHDAPVCKHLYAAMENLSKNKKEINKLYSQLEALENGESTDFSIDSEDAWNEVFEDMDKEQVSLENSGQQKVVKSEYTNNLLATIISSSINQFEKERYEIIPELVVNEKEMGLKLKLNVLGGKSFVVKNIYELPLLFQNKLSQTFGVDTEVTFIREKFKNLELVDFLIREINRGCALLNTVSAKGKTDWYGYYTPGKVQYDKKQLQLSPGTLLSYLELMSGQTIKFKYENERITNYLVDKSKRKYKLDIEDFGEYVTLEGEDILQFIQCKNNVIIIDSIHNVIELLELSSESNAQAMCSLFNYPHIINKENAKAFYEALIKNIGNHLSYDYDFSKLYEDVTYIGFRAHLQLSKAKLIVSVKLNDEDYDQSLENGMIEGRILFAINEVLNLYGQPEYDVYEKGTSKFEIKGINNIIDFVNKYLKPFEQICEVITSNEEFKNFKIVDKVPVQITQTRSKGKSILKFESSEFSESELLELLKSIDSVDSHLALESGKVIDLNSEQVKEVIDAANKLDLNLAKAKSTEFEVELASVFYYNKIFDSLNLLVKKESVIDELVTDYNSLDSKFRKPKNLIAELRKYQKFGVNWLKFLEKYNFGGILADDMGLGKTLQVISHLSTNKSKLPTIIITPASLIYNWKYEFEKFTTNTDVLVIDGSVKERSEIIAQIKKEVCIVSYDTFKRDYEQLSEFKFNYAILDEAQHIKNANTKVAKAVKAIDSEHRLALTGTPIENNLNELWSLFDFIMPSFLSSNKEFKKQYITPIENGRSEVQDKLKQKISPFILRRLKGDVLTELPAKTEKIVHIKMQSDQQKLYDSYAMELKNFLEKTSEDEMKTKQIEVLAMITKLRQIACNPILQNENYKGTNSKQEYLTTHLETLIDNKHKTVLFSQFVSNFKYIEEELDKQGIKYCKITGQTPKQKRFEMVDSFNQDDTPIFLISLKAGGTGLNITGADTVIHYDPWWNTAVESQATDRVHRMGQENNVFVYKLICEKTIEEQIVKLQEQKRKLSESLLDADSIGSSRLTKDEVLSLL